MKNFTNKAGRDVGLLALLGISMLSAGYLPTSQAHAQQQYSYVETEYTRYVLRVDCHGSNLDNTTSTDRVDVEFVFSDGKVHKTSTSSTLSSFIKDNRPVCSGSTDARYETPWLRNPAAKVTEVKLTTNGSDALWMDQLRLSLDRGTRKCEETKGILNSSKCYSIKERKFEYYPVHSWGMTDGGGYCLSRQSNDAGAFNGKTFGGKCYETLKFFTRDSNSVSGILSENQTASTSTAPPCAAKSFIRSASDHSWVRFKLPKGKDQEVIKIPDGSYNNQQFPASS